MALAYIIHAEDLLTQFAKISTANTINPQTVSDLLLALIEETDHCLADIYNDAGELKVSSYTRNTLKLHLNTIYDRLNLFDEIVQKLQDAGLISDQLSTTIPLASGSYREDTKDILWYAANGNIIIRQWKANSTTNVSSAYINEPRIYKEHILHFHAQDGYTLQSVQITYNGQYRGDSLTAGILLDSTGSNVVDDESTITKMLDKINNGTHTFKANQADGVQDLYIQNVATNVVQLRITNIKIYYKTI